jgi:hypothetical protein
MGIRFQFIRDMDFSFYLKDLFRKIISFRNKQASKLHFNGFISIIRNSNFKQFLNKMANDCYNHFKHTYALIFIKNKLQKIKIRFFLASK